MTIEQHLNNVFYSAAKQEEEAMRGKIYSYKFFSNNIMSPDLLAEGKCFVISVNYSRTIDCNMITVEDVETHQRYTGNEFRFVLEEERR